MLTSTVELMEEGRIQSTAAALTKQFGNEARMRIASESKNDRNAGSPATGLRR